MGGQVWTQIKGVAVTVVFTGIASLVLLKVVDLLVGLRVSPEDETLGLDLALHDERGYNL
jgi:Amt family ammonium transporter